MIEQEPHPSQKYDEAEEKIQQWKKANPKSTLTEIEEAIDGELAKLRRKMIEEITQERAEEAEKEMTCPHCEGKMVKNGKKKRELRSKGGEKISLNRWQMRCLRCGMTLFPPG